MKPVALKAHLKTLPKRIRTYSADKKKRLFSRCRANTLKTPFIVLDVLGDDKYLLATVNRKKLETRFVEASLANKTFKNDSYDIYIIETFLKGMDPSARITTARPLLEIMPKIAGDAKFEYNSANEYAFTKDLDFFFHTFALCYPDHSPAEFLRGVYDNANKTYHHGKEDSPLTDKEFDNLHRFLVENNLIENKKVAPAVPENSKRKVQLANPMGSLENAMTLEDLTKWARKTGIRAFVATPKIDGISCQLDYVKGKLTLATTKGDGAVGEDITRHVMHIPNVPKTLSTPATISPRGEIYMLNSTFDKKYSVAKGTGRFKTARNATGGVLNRNTPDKEMLAALHFSAYSIMGKEEVEAKGEQLLKLYKLGIPTVSYKEIKSPKDLAKADEYLKDYRKADYAQDGIVIEAMYADDRKRLGYETNSINPAYARAFKPDAVSAETTVKEIEWNVSRHKYAIPTAILKPVDIGGVTVSRVTLHHANHVRDRKVGPGAVIKLTRSGDAIPFLQDVIKPGASGLPDKNAFGGWHWSDTNVDIIVGQEVESETHEIEELVHFFEAVGIERFGIGLITRFYREGYKELFDILRMSEKDMVDNIEGVQSSTAKRLRADFDKLKDPGVPLPTLMYASGIFGRGFGRSKFKDLYAEFGDDLVYGWKDFSLNDIAASISRLPNFSEKSGKAFAKAIKPFLQFLRDGRNLISIRTSRKSDNKSSRFANQVVVFTGFRDKNLAKIVEDNGGTYSDNISRKTTLLVNGGDTNSVKAVKAAQMGIKVISLEQFRKQIGD